MINISANNCTYHLFLSCQFHGKDLGHFRYFLAIEVDHVSQGFFLSQGKYTLDLLKCYTMENCRPLKLLMDVNLTLSTTTSQANSKP